jgi:multicomponent Na+:H+ antiporter subunit G
MSVLGVICLALGSIFVMLAGLGLYRMPNFYMRMQAAAKASTVGAIFMLFGTFLLLPSWEVASRTIIISLFLLLTTPLATHAMAKAARDRHKGEERRSTGKST